LVFLFSELLFTLRGVDPSELVAERAALAIPEVKAEGKRSRRVLPSSALSDVFGIEIQQPPARTRARKRALVAERRGASDVAGAAELVLAFVKSHPGMGVEVIGESLGLSTRPLSLPLKKLIALGSIVNVGLRRATKYFATPHSPRRPRSRA
jgi:hypothetical protein